MSELTSDELARLFTLNSQQRGNYAELAFMRKAASMGFSMAKPWQDGERYDVILRVENTWWRVQVKSTLGKTPGTHHYRIKTSGGGSHSSRHHIHYSANDIDFLVAYLIREDLWYVFPVAVIEQKRVVVLRPGSKRSCFEQYREAWHLFQIRGAEPARQASAAAAGT